MLSLKIAATGLAVAALAWLALQVIDDELWALALVRALIAGLVASIIAGLFAVWG